MTYKYNNKSTGFSLVELMVAMAIGLFLMAGLIQVISSNQVGVKQLGVVSVQLDNSRHAFNRLNFSVRLAGHYLGVSPGDLNNAAVITGAGNCNAAWVANLVEPVTGYGDTRAMPDNCLAHQVDNSDAFVVRYADPTESVAEADLPNNTDLYLAAYPFSTLLLFNASSGVPASDTLTAENKASVAFNIQRFRADIYYLRECSVLDGDKCEDGVPTLVRARLQGGAYSDEPLVDNVEQMQVQYGERVGNNNISFSDEAGVGNWQNVVSLRIDLVVRGEAPDQTIYADIDNTFGMAGGFEYTVSSDKTTVQGQSVNLQHYPRELFSQTIQIRNSFQEN